MPGAVGHVQLAPGTAGVALLAEAAVHAHLGDVDWLAQRGEGVQHFGDRHHIPAGEVELDAHHVKVHTGLQDGLEVGKRRAQMLRQRAVAVVAARDVLREG